MAAVAEKQLTGQTQQAAVMLAIAADQRHERVDCVRHDVVDRSYYAACQSSGDRQMTERA
jgi:hypothetical protein